MAGASPQCRTSAIFANKKGIGASADPSKRRPSLKLNQSIA
jgi:hypothetical protein